MIAPHVLEVSAFYSRLLCDVMNKLNPRVRVFVWQEALAVTHTDIQADLYTVGTVYKLCSLQL